MRVTITQPYVPQYREPLFAGLFSELQSSNVEMRVFYGCARANKGSPLRRQDATHPAWSEEVPVRTIKVVGTTSHFQYRRLPLPWRMPDLLLTEQEAGNLNAWDSKRIGAPYVLMGHGKSYTSVNNILAERMERRLNRGAAHILTYMPSGRDHVLSDPRIDPNKVTAFMNSTDTADLRLSIQSLTESDDTDFRARHNIPEDARVALYIGSLTPYKRIDLLCAAATIVLEADPHAWLLVAGSGEENYRFAQLASHGRITVLGHSGPMQVAAASRISRLIVNPGRIGLVAVDAIAMGLPILSTRYPFHAPEVEYLRESIDVFFAADTKESLAEEWVHLLAINRSHRISAIIPTIEAAITTIADVLVTTLQATPPDVISI